MRHAQRSVIFGGDGAGRPLRIGWVTDQHVDSTSNGNPDHPGATLGVPPNSNYFWQAAARWNSVAAKLNAIHAAEPLHCLVNTGDVANEALASDWALWQPAWDNLNMPTMFTPGNVDVSPGAGRDGYSDIVTRLGYGGRVENANSAFNHAWSLTGGDVAARMVTLDTTLQSDGTRGAHPGYLPEAARDWLEAQLLSAVETVALVWSHHGPPSVAMSEFNSDDAAAVGSLLNRVTAARPNLRIHWLYGHEHYVTSVKRATVPATNVPGWCGPAVVQYADGPRFNVVSVYRDGSITFDQYGTPAPT